MTVAELIKALQQMPSAVVVLLEGDAGYAAISGLDLETNDSGMPDEVILLPDMSE
jgi:hypothetical protein